MLSRGWDHDACVAAFLRLQGTLDLLASSSCWWWPWARGPFHVVQAPDGAPARLSLLLFPSSGLAHSGDPGYSPGEHCSRTNLVYVSGEQCGYGSDMAGQGGRPGPGVEWAGTDAMN